MTVKLKDVVKFIQAHLGRLADSLKRAKNLVSIYKNAIKANPSDESKYSDLLRAAVVFTHAALEDFLRSLASVYLPYADEKVLDKIPLAGSEGHTEKFCLGKLAPHRKKTIDELIKLSVNDNLKRTTYNNTTDITCLLQQIGLDVEKVRPTFPQLEKLIKRRHQIVHNCDKINASSGDKTEKLKVRTVEVWIKTVGTFGTKIVAQCISTKLGKK